MNYLNLFCFIISLLGIDTIFIVISLLFQLLRSSLVNNRTQAVVCDDLGMANYAVYNNPKAELKTKDRADLLEAFIGALYVDQVCFCLIDTENMFLKFVKIYI